MFERLVKASTPHELYLSRVGKRIRFVVCIAVYRDNITFVVLILIKEGDFHGVGTALDTLELLGEATLLNVGHRK